MHAISCCPRSNYSLLQQPKKMYHKKKKGLREKEQTLAALKESICTYIEVDLYLGGTFPM